MAKTTAADVASQTPEVWGTELYAQAENLTFWHQFEGPEGSGAPIIRKDDLEKGEGDTIHMDIVLSLTGAGQTGDTTSVEGNEEKLVYRQTDLGVEALSHGVRWTKKGKILINHNMRVNARSQLAKWLAGKQDDAVWNELTGQTGNTTMPTANKWFGGSATARTGVADGDATGRVTLTDITEMKAYAQTELKMEPLRTENGEEYFGLALHPYSTMALKKSTAWQQAMREAMNLGKENPLFTGSAALWDGVIIWTNNRVPRSTNGTIMTADNVFFGAQALSRGYAYYPDWVEEYFDYGREQGIATYTIKGEKLNVFDLTSAGGAAAASLTAIGSMVYYAAAVAPTA